MNYTVLQSIVKNGVVYIEVAAKHRNIVYYWSKTQNKWKECSYSMKELS